MFHRYKGKHAVVRAIKALSVRARIGIASGTIAALSVTGLALANSASAATFQVAVSVGSWHCPSGYTPYVRGVAGDGANGYGGIQTWTGYARTAYVTVVGVPSGGMPVNVTVAYSCKGYWPWQQTTPAP